MTNRQSIHRKLFLSLLLCTALGGSGFLTACSSSSENEQHKRITAPESSVAAVVDTNNTENSKTGEASVPDTYENTSVEKPLLAFADEDTDTSYDTESAAVISFSGSNANIGGSGAAFENGTLKITESGTYILSGNLTGQILISAGKDDVIRLVLDNVNITSSSASALYAEKCGKTILLLKDGTENTLSDGSGYVTDEDTDSDSPNAAVYCKDDLTILGGGTLIVNGNAKNGITSKDNLRISSGNIQVNAQHNGITGRDFLAVQGGTITVKAADGDGLRSTYSDEDKSDKGHITIENTAVTVDSGDDGIQAAKQLYIGNGDLNITAGGGASDAASQQNNFGGFRQQMQQQTSSESEESKKGLKAGSMLTIGGGKITVDSYDDAIHSNGEVLVNDGTLNIKAGDDGIHADTTLSVSGGAITVEKSYEGFEGIVVNISGGLIDITASDDGINAAGGNDFSGFGNFDNNMNFGGRRFPRGNFTRNETSDEMPSDMPNMPQGNIPDGFTGEMPSDMPSMPQGNIPDGFTGEMPSDMPNMPQGNIPGGFTGEMPSDMSNMPQGNIPDGFTGEMPSDMPSMPQGNIPDGFTGEMPQNENPNENNSGEDDTSISTSLNISGGTIYINAQGDGVDSNSALNISGGLIVVNGTTSGGNGIIDHDGNCLVSGGTLIGAGTYDMLEMPGENSTQKTVAVMFEQNQSAGTLVYITDSSGKVLAAMSPEKNYSCLILSCAELKENETYSVYIGGTADGESTHGYYTSPTVSGGTQYTSFTITDTVTYVNQNGVTTYSGMGFGRRINN